MNTKSEAQTEPALPAWAVRMQQGYLKALKRCDRTGSRPGGCTDPQLTYPSDVFDDFLEDLIMAAPYDSELIRYIDANYSSVRAWAAEVLKED